MLYTVLGQGGVERLGADVVRVLVAVANPDQIELLSAAFALANSG